MARVSTYLNFPGSTEEAFTFYKSVFGTEFDGGIHRMGDVPPQAGQPPLSEDDKNLVMHVALPILGGHMLMGTDAPESMGFTLNQGNNVYINLEPDTRAETDRLFAALSDGGTVEMPLQEMFWGDYFGSITDKFGVKWMFNCGEKSKPGRAASSDAGGAPPQPRKQKIVIVEDNASLAEIYQTRLELIGYQCFTAYDGEAALATIEKELPDLVLLDLMVPKIAGDQILARMRASDWGKKIRVYIISNLNEADAPAGLRDYGIEGYTVKANLSNDDIDKLVDKILTPPDQQENVVLE